MAEIIFNQFVITFLVRSFAYASFTGCLRWGKKRTVLILTVTEVVWLLFVGFCVHAGIPVSIAQLMAIPFFGIIYFCSVQLEWGKILFLYVFSTAYCMVLRGGAAFLEQLLFQDNGKALYSWHSSILMVVLFVLTMPLMLWYFKRTAQMVIETAMPDFWKKIWLLPLFNTLMVLLLTYSLDSEPGINMRFLVVRILLLLSLFLVYYFVLYSIRQLQQQIAAEKHVRFLEQMTKLQRTQYTLLQEHIEETRRMRHDLRQHLSAIQGYIDRDNLQGLAAYIQSYRKSMPKESTPEYCRNYAVDSILGYYAEKAEQENIQMEIMFCPMPETIIPEPEFCVLLGNLLENAIEACSRAKDSTSSVQSIVIRARKSGSHTLFLTVDNTCPVPPQMEQEYVLSTRHEGYGIGTQSVRSIAGKYHGDARFEWKDGMFYVSVMLNQRTSAHESNQRSTWST